MVYRITEYTKSKANQLGVIVKPSTNKNKKLDVYDKYGNFICAIGAAGMGDFPTYIESHGLEYAKYRRKLYKQRHEADRHVKDSPGYYADKVLW